MRSRWLRSDGLKVFVIILSPSVAAETRTVTLLHCYVRTIGVIVMGACNRVLLVVGGTIGGDNNMVGFVMVMD